MSLVSEAWLDEGPVPLSQFKLACRKAFLDLVSLRRADKALFAEVDLGNALLWHIVESGLLREHGIRRVMPFGNEASVDIGDAKFVLYCVRATVDNASAIARHMLAVRRGVKDAQFAVLWVPAEAAACRKVLEGAGVLADFDMRALPLHFFVLDNDLMTMQLPTALPRVLVSKQKDTHVLHLMSLALQHIQSVHGTIVNIKGVGRMAHVLKDLIVRAHRSTAEQITPGGGRVASMVLVDRSADIVTPLCLQQTFEGFLDEFLGVSCGHVQYHLPSGDGGTSAAATKELVLKPDDACYKDIRDSHFEAAVERLGETMREARSQYHKVDGPEMSQMRSKLASARSTQSVEPYINALVDAKLRACMDGSMGEWPNHEYRLQSGFDTHLVWQYLEGLIMQGADVTRVLRMLCLLCATTRVDARRIAETRRQILRVYGGQYILVLNALHQAGLVRANAAKPAAASLIERCKLVVEAFTEMHAPRSPHYCYGGYKPLSVHLVEQLLRNRLLSKKDIVDRINGGAFDVDIVEDEGGLLQEAAGTFHVKPRRQASSPVAGEVLPTVLVVFIGGCTYAELSALRFIAKHNMNCRLVFLTTAVITGDRFVNGFVDMTLQHVHPSIPNAKGPLQ